MEAQKKHLLRSRLTPELTLDSDEILLIKLTLNSIYLGVKVLFKAWF